MNKQLLIGSVVVGILIILGVIVYGLNSRMPSYHYSTESPAALSPTQAGVDDLASEADVSATLDTNMDSDVTQLDTELKGL